MKKLLYLLTASLFSALAYAQIPNPGFESWSTATGGYQAPVSWDSPDSLCNLVGASYLTCEQGAPGHTGSYYLKLTSKTVPGFGVAAGLAMSGKLDFTNYLPKYGYAFTSRPANLTGYWQYQAATGDTGVIAVGLTKWNTSQGRRDTVAAFYYKLPSAVTSWAPFSIGITYVKNSYPDTATIYLSSSGATTAADGSYLYIDDLAFTGTMPVGVAEVNGAQAKLSVFPNPAKGVINVNVPSAANEPVHIVITGIAGNVLREVNATTNTATSISLDGAPGLYFITAQTAGERWYEKVIVQN